MKLFVFLIRYLNILWCIIIRIKDYNDIEKKTKQNLEIEKLFKIKNSQW